MTTEERTAVGVALGRTRAAADALAAACGALGIAATPETLDGGARDV